MLDAKSGAGSSLTPYIIAFGGGMVTLVVAAFVSWLLSEEPLMAALIVVVILFFGLRSMFRLLPPLLREIIGDLAHWLIRLVLGTGNKGRV